ncbi:MAG: hypothetical protein H6R30_331 [Methanomicrobia archaeon]|nr:hypothetical protein [Methanomicrobia archaeon]MBS1194993.1 hypothetical protein [Methanomicrobia archaeon]MDD1634629.1 DUF424 domain-containing protein [Methanomicrobiales archaeon]MDD1638927.1 DUF424 domain-containing protein [Methanomicrobiales archaeon]
MFLKVHRAPDGAEVVAICDRELLNTTITHGDITLRISESFYGNRPASEEEVRKNLQTASNANLIGERCVALAVEMGFVERSGCIMLGKVPHAQVFRI